MVRESTVYLPYNYTHTYGVFPPLLLFSSSPVSGAAGSRTGCDALVEGTIDVAVRTAKLLNDHGKVPM